MTRNDSGAEPENMPPYPEHPPKVRGGNKPSDSDAKYCQTLKPVLPAVISLIGLIVSCVVIIIAAHMQNVSLIAVIIILVIVLVTIIIWYLWARTYLIITNTRAILSTITPFGNKSPNVLLKEAGRQEVTQNLIDKLLRTCSLHLDTPSDKDGMWTPLRWARNPEELRAAIGLPTLQEMKSITPKR